MRRVPRVHTSLLGAVLSAAGQQGQPQQYKGISSSSSIRLNSTTGEVPGVEGQGVEPEAEEEDSMLSLMMATPSTTEASSAAATGSTGTDCGGADDRRVPGDESLHHHHHPTSHKGIPFPHHQEERIPSDGSVGAAQHGMMPMARGRGPSRAELTKLLFGRRAQNRNQRPTFRDEMQTVFDHVSSLQERETHTLGAAATSQHSDTEHQVVHATRHLRVKADWRGSLAVLAGTLAATVVEGSSPSLSSWALRPMISDTLSSCVTRHSWEGALKTFELVCDASIAEEHPSVFQQAWSQTLLATGKASRWQEAMSALSAGLSSSHSLPTPRGLAYLTEACATSQVWELSLLVFELCRAEGAKAKDTKKEHQPPTATSSSDSDAQKSTEDEAEAEIVRKKRLALHQHHCALPYFTTARGLLSAGKPESALKVLELMAEDGVVDTKSSLNAKVGALCHLGRTEEALEVLLVPPANTDQRPAKAVFLDALVARACVASAQPLLKQEGANTSSSSSSSLSAWEAAIQVLTNKGTTMRSRRPAEVAMAMSLLPKRTHWEMAFVLYNLAEKRPPRRSPDQDKKKRRAEIQAFIHGKDAVFAHWFDHVKASPHPEDWVDHVAGFYPDVHWSPLSLPLFLSLLESTGRRTSVVSTVQAADKIERETENQALLLSMAGREVAVRSACALSKWTLALRHLDLLLDRVGRFGRKEDPLALLPQQQQQQQHSISGSPGAVRDVETRKEVRLQTLAHGLSSKHPRQRTYIAERIFVNDCLGSLAMRTLPLVSDRISVLGHVKTETEYWQEWSNRIAEDILPLVCEVCKRCGYKEKDWRHSSCP